MKIFIQGLIGAVVLSMIALAAPVGICLYAYSPEAPVDKIECFEFEKTEKYSTETRFYQPNGKIVVITNYRNRGVVLYPTGVTGTQESLATLLAS